MAQILDGNEEGQLDLEELTDGSQQATVPVEELPEKFKGKSSADIVKMYSELEKAYGRQGQEVHEVRQLADQLLRQSFQQAPAKQEKPSSDIDSLDEVDFFADPKAAVAKAVASHPAVVNAQNAVVQMARAESLRTLQQQHPDYREVVQDPEFVSWVKDSKVRQSLYAAADRNYDFDAANELLSTYKAIKGTKRATTNEEVQQVQQTQEKALKAASNPAVGSSGEGSSKKIYRRADLIRLRMERPNDYEAREAEIMLAYAEGRVR